MIDHQMELAPRIPFSWTLAVQLSALQLFGHQLLHQQLKLFLEVGNPDAKTPISFRLVA